MPSCLVVVIRGYRPHSEASPQAGPPPSSTLIEAADQAEDAVNLDVDDDQVIDLELMRRGIRKRGVFGLIGSLDKG